MKKLTALLFACMMMTCTFTACGKKSGSTSDTKKNTSTSETTTDDDETEPTINKKKPSTTEAEEKTSKETEEKNSEDDTEDSEFIGKWELIMGIEEDGTILEEDPEGEFENYREYRLEAYSDGTGYVDYFGEKQDFEWKKKDENVIELLDDNKNTALFGFIINSSSFTISEDDTFMIFEKVKEFSDTDNPIKNSNKIENKIIGKWEAVKCVSIDYEEFEEDEKVEVEECTPDLFCIEFDSDGTVSAGYMGEIQIFEWKKKGEYTVEVYADETHYDDDEEIVSREFAISGNSMICYEDNGSFTIFEKVK